MLAVTRFRAPEPQADSVGLDLRAVLNLLRTKSGFLNGHIGRAADEPDLWVLVTHWSGAGSYRRALSSYDIKVSIAPLMASAIVEPGAFEVVE